MVKRRYIKEDEIIMVLFYRNAKLRNNNLNMISSMDHLTRIRYNLLHSNLLFAKFIMPKIHDHYLYFHLLGSLGKALQKVFLDVQK